MEKSGTDKNIFEKLKEIRIQKGISLESIAEKSRIQLKYLESIEKGDILQIPAVYDKLFFRSYLDALGVEQELYFADFIEIRKSLRLDKTTTLIQVAKSKDPSKERFPTNRIMFVLLPFILVVAVLAFLFINTEMIVTSNEGKVQEIDIKNVVQRMEAQEQAKQDSVKSLVDQDSTLYLNIRALKRTWLRVVKDKTDTTEFLLRVGQDVTMSADSLFEFLIGRADGLRFTLNNKLLDPIGVDSTVVRYMRVDSSGIASKILTSIDSQ